MKAGDAMNGTRVGTPLYLSPEVIQSMPYDFKTDIWAAGCALHHLAALEPPFQSDNLVTLGNLIVSRKPKAIPPVYSQRLNEFITKLMQKKAVDRPSAKQAITMLPGFVQKGYENINLVA